MKVLTFGQSKAQANKQEIKKLQAEHKQLVSKLSAKHARHIERNKADYDRAMKLEQMINDLLMGAV